MKRRQFIAAGLASSGSLLLPGCSSEAPPGRYTAEDQALLEAQRQQEAAASGTGPLGPQRYPGYRGLAQLPWFDLDDSGQLFCSDDSVPEAIDIHAHLGISVLFAPDIDLQQSHPRTLHLLDSDATNPGHTVDLDVYANSNFSEEQLEVLSRNTLAQGLWGSPYARTQTIANLLAEMDAMRISQALLLPIKMGLPFNDDLTERWRAAVARAGAAQRLPCGLSVHPRGKRRIEELREHATKGARFMKLHPTVQAFYPDDPDMMPLYEEAQSLGVALVFHGGRAGIEPESRLRYAMPRHYEAVLANFPRLQVVLAHSGARDSAAMVDMARRYPNAWLDIHGQGVSKLQEIIEASGGERLLFGTDWPFYHMGMSLAKVLLCTQQPQHKALRQRILRDNALQLLGKPGGQPRGQPEGQVSKSE